MFQYNLGRLFRNGPSADEGETRLSRREMLGITGLFMVAASVMLRPSEVAASVIKPSPVLGEAESELTNVPFKPEQDAAEVIEIGRRRRRRQALRRRRRRRYYGRSHWRRGHRSPDFCVWGPWGGFCVD